MSFRSWKFVGAALAGMISFTANAQETTTYTYDSLGRVVKVTVSGGPSSGVHASYKYDAAGNRTNATVTDKPVYIVLPLKGFTLIRVR